MWDTNSIFVCHSSDPELARDLWDVLLVLWVLRSDEVEHTLTWFVLYLEALGGMGSNRGKSVCTCLEQHSASLSWRGPNKWQVDVLFCPKLKLKLLNYQDFLIEWMEYICIDVHLFILLNLLARQWLIQGTRTPGISRRSMEDNCFPVAFGLVVESGFPSLLLRKDGFWFSFFRFLEETHS